MALFGPSDPNNPGLMSRLFGGGNAGNAAAPAPQPQTPTAQVAEQTGATASSPFLQYLQANAPAAQQTAQALMGAAPEADYRAALIQAGLGILSQPGGQSPLQAIAAGAQTAMPLFLQEQQRVRDYDQQVQNLAAKLNVSAAEFDTKSKDDNPFVEFNGNVYEKDKLYKLVAEGKTSPDELDQALVIPKHYEAEQTSEALARTEREYIRLQGRPDLTPKQRERLEFLETKMSALRAQIFPQKESGPGTATIITDDGRIVTVSADSSELASSIKQFGDQEQASKLQQSQQAVADAAGYTSRLFELLKDAPPGAAGTLGGLAGKTAAWGDLLLGKMQGPVREQFTTEVQGRPLERLDEMMKDPEARAWLDDGLYDKLRTIGVRNTQLLSNIIGLGYATAKASDEGGKLSDSDVALNLRKLGYDLDAWLNDPASVRAGLLDTLRSNVSQHLTKLMFTAESPEEAEKLLETNLLTNTVLPQMGLEWRGGIDGQLIYRSQRPESGSDMRPPALDQSQGLASSGQPVQIQSKEQFDQLPSGTRFVAPDGSVRVKP